MKRIRAGFLVGAMSERWLGGLNYFRNLFAALEEWPERTVDPIFVLGRKSEEQHYRDFSKIEKVRTASLDRFHPAWCLRLAVLKTFGHDLVLGAALRRNRVDIQSHSAAVARSAVPVASWIPDFQHVHLPVFFSRKSLRARDLGFRRAIRFSKAIILSSHDARKDLANYDAEAVKKSHVLHFVASPPSAQNVPSRAALEAKYQIRGPYFHLPNQFWAHKNHQVVIEALQILKTRGNQAQVLATGNMKDGRQPDFFENLMKQAGSMGVGDQFRVLGLVPYGDLVGLMENSTALINPSLFEGWSTSVEEAKSLGKRMILSNLDVHREQNPREGVYFDPARPDELARCMEAVLSDGQFNGAALLEIARAEFPARRRAFAADYCAMIAKITTG